MGKFCTKARPADCLLTQILWATSYGFLSKHLVVVAVVFIKTLACIRGRVILILEWKFARVIFEGGMYSRAACTRGRHVLEGRL